MPGLHIDEVGNGQTITNNNITYAAPVSNVEELDNLPDDAKKDEQRRFVRTVNNYYYYNSSVNEWFPVEESVASPAKPKIYGDDVRDLEELQAIPEKDLTPDEHRYVELEGRYFIYKGDTNVWEKVEIQTEVPFAPKVNEHPQGRKDQLYFIKEHGTNKVIPDYLLKRGIIVQTQREFDVASIADINLKEVFRSWGMFAHADNDLGGGVSPPTFPALTPEDPQGSTRLTPEEFYAGGLWKYDENNNRIYLTKNVHPYTGFVSPREFGNFKFEATLSSSNDDNDWLALVIGFWTDPVTEYQHTLSVVRTYAMNSGQSEFSYAIVKNFRQKNSEIIVNATELAPPLTNGNDGLVSNGWASNGPTRIAVERVGNIYNIKCSQFNSVVIDPTTEIVLDVSQDEKLEPFTVATRVAFAAASQINAFFSDIVFTGLIDYIFYDKGDFYETYEYDPITKEYFLQDPQTVFCKDYFGMNRFVDSYMFDKQYYITERDEIVCFKGNEGVSWDADNALSIGSDNKPFLNKADLGSGGTSTITRATISAMIADQENQAEGDTVKVTDASEDPTVEFGEWYYEYLGTLNATLEDYRKLTEGEISLIATKQVTKWQYFNGDGVETEFILTGDIILVEIDGRIQKSEVDYTVVNSKITFTKAPYNGANIGVLKGKMAANSISASVTFEPNTWRPELSSGDTAQQTAYKVNAAINAAKSVNGVVMIPAGIYTSLKWNWDPRVRLIGAGKKATKIISGAAGALIEYTGNELANPTASIEQMSLFGGVDENNRVGTTALNLQRIAFFKHSDLNIRNFSGNAMEFVGALIGEFNNVDMRYCGGGVKALRANTSTVGSLNPNLVIFNRCSFTYVSGWSVDWEKAANLQFLSCDFELSGISSTGLIKLTNFAPNAEGIGLKLDGCWGEYNNGIGLKIQGNSKSRHTIRNTMFQYANHSKHLELDGGKMFLGNTVFANSNGSETVDIINGELESMASDYGTVTLQNASTHKKHQPVTVQ